MIDELQAVSQYISEQIDIPGIVEQAEPIIIFVVFLALYAVFLLLFS